MVRVTARGCLRRWRAVICCGVEWNNVWTRREHECFGYIKDIRRGFDFVFPFFSWRMDAALCVRHQMNFYKHLFHWFKGSSTFLQCGYFDHNIHLIDLVAAFWGWCGCFWLLCEQPNNQSFKRQHSNYHLQLLLQNITFILKYIQKWANIPAESVDDVIL